MEKDKLFTVGLSKNVEKYSPRFHNKKGWCRGLLIPLPLNISYGCILLCVWGVMINHPTNPCVGGWQQHCKDQDMNNLLSYKLHVILRLYKPSPTHNKVATRDKKISLTGIQIFEGSNLLLDLCHEISNQNCQTCCRLLLSLTQLSPSLLLYILPLSWIYNLVVEM